MRNEEWRFKSLRDLSKLKLREYAVWKQFELYKSKEIRKDFLNNSSFLIPNS